MRVGLLGWAGVGKTSVFSVLTSQEVPAHARNERHLATVDVIDERLDRLRKLWNPRKFTRARFEVEDFPGLPRGGGKLSADVLNAMRDLSALLLVIGAFDDCAMSLPDDITEPEKQLQALREDLLFLDLEVVEKRIQRLEERLQKGAGDRINDARTVEFLKSVQTELEAGRPPAQDPDKEQRAVLDEMRLLVEKAQVVVVNVEEGADTSALEPLTAGPGGGVVLCAPIEWEIAQMEGDDRQEFLDSYGLNAPAANRLTLQAYRALDLISFFTMGEDEVRAWPVPRGSDAVTSAGKIHTDLARGFIRAEVTAFEAVKDLAEIRQIKAEAKADLKGKDYVVADGDILNIRFSV